MTPASPILFALPDALSQHPVPPLLLQLLVEAAIRHGLEPKVGKGQIEISAGARGSKLVLVVADEGVGMESDAATSGAASGSGFVWHRFASGWPGCPRVADRFRWNRRPAKARRSRS